MILYLIMAGLLIAGDQLIKQWAIEVLKPAVSIDIIPGMLSLYYHENFGAAWGILQGQRWLLLVVTGAVILAMLAALVTKRLTWGRSASAGPSSRRNQRSPSSRETP